MLSSWRSPYTSSTGGVDKLSATSFVKDGLVLEKVVISENVMGAGLNERHTPDGHYQCMELDCAGRLPHRALLRPRGSRSARGRRATTSACAVCTAST